MERKDLACFSVRVLSNDNSTWQGVVEAEGETFVFQSEMQLLKWLCKIYPQLIPDTLFGSERQQQRRKKK